MRAIRVRNVDTHHRVWPDLHTCDGRVLELDSGAEALVDGDELGEKPIAHLRIMPSVKGPLAKGTPPPDATNRPHDVPSDPVPESTEPA